MPMEGYVAHAVPSAVPRETLSHLMAYIGVEMIIAYDPFQSVMYWSQSWLRFSHGFGHDYKSELIARNRHPKQRFTLHDAAILALHRSLSLSVATV